MSTAEAQAPVELRVIWEDPDQTHRLVARDWPDGCPTSYAFMTRQDGAWVWNTLYQRADAREALYRWLDAQNVGEHATMRIVL